MRNTSEIITLAEYKTHVVKKYTTTTSNLLRHCAACHETFSTSSSSVIMAHRTCVPDHLKQDECTK